MIATLSDVTLYLTAAGIALLAVYWLARASDNRPDDEADSRQRMKDEIAQIRIHRPDHFGRGADEMKDPTT
jgi:hypothetical protein